MFGYWDLVCLVTEHGETIMRIGYPNSWFLYLFIIKVKLFFFFLINKYFIKKRKRIQRDLQSWKKRKLKQNKYQAFLLQNGQKLNEKPSTTQKEIAKKKT
jgi:uncharacterized protein YneF (UPF0154 family)